MSNIKCQIKNSVNPPKRYRLAVFRSNRYIYAQIIDDSKGDTLVSSSSSNLDPKIIKGKKPVEIAALVGADIAKKAKTKKISHLYLDKGKFKYHGQIASLTDALRHEGLKL